MRWSIGQSFGQLNHRLNRTVSANRFIYIYISIYNIYGVFCEFLCNRSSIGFNMQEFVWVANLSASSLYEFFLSLSLRVFLFLPLIFFWLSEISCFVDISLLFLFVHRVFQIPPLAGDRFRIVQVADKLLDNGIRQNDLFCPICLLCVHKHFKFSS